MTHKQSSVSAAPAASTSLPKADVVSLLVGSSAAVCKPVAAFTRHSVKGMRCPDSKTEVFFWDASCPGFGLRVLNSGRRSWIYQYRDGHKRTRRIVIGDEAKVDLDTARKTVRRHAASIAQGANPSVDRKTKRHALTVLDVVELYLEQARTRQRERSFVETRRHLRCHAAPLHYERVEAVGRRNISELLARVAERSGPVAANRLRAALSTMWTWALRSGRVGGDTNPVTFTIRQDERHRDRVLSDSELRAIWQATESAGQYNRIIRLCLLTGCRRDEIGGLRWDEIQQDRLVIARDRMKGNRHHEVPLLPLIKSVLPARPDSTGDCIFGRHATGFSGWSKSKQALDAKVAKTGVKMPPWTLHDLRRTFSTTLLGSGA